MKYMYASGCINQVDFKKNMVAEQNIFQPYFVVCSGFVLARYRVCVLCIYLVWITAVVNLLLLQALDELMASRNWRIFLVFVQVVNIF